MLALLVVQLAAPAAHALVDHAPAPVTQDFAGHHGCASPDHGESGDDRNDRHDAEHCPVCQFLARGAAAPQMPVALPGPPLVCIGRLHVVTEDVAVGFGVGCHIARAPPGRF